jgi:uncharacterized protein (DUF58 family)
MITRRGVGFTIGAVAIFFLASVTRVGWLHLADALLWGMLVLGLAAPWLSMTGLKARRRVNPGDRAIGPVAGDTVEIEVEVENRSVVPRYLVSATYESALTTGGPRQRIFFAHAPARRAMAGGSVLECNVRGRHRVGPMRLECAAPFGLFRRRRTVEAPFELLVYPRWHEMERVGLLEAPAGETQGRRTARHGVDVAGSRRYASGDSVRSVHWRNTARTGRLMVKEYDAGAEESVVIAFDTAAPVGTAPESTLEYAISIAASASRALMRNRTPVSLAIGAAPTAASTDWRGMMETLAQIEPAPRRPLGNSLALLPLGSRVLAIIAANDEVSAKTLAALSRRGAAVAAVVLEGFAPGQSASPVAASLRSAGASVTACRQGGLQDALREVARGVASRRPAAAARAKPEAAEAVAVEARAA